MKPCNKCNKKDAGFSVVEILTALALLGSLTYWLTSTLVSFSVISKKAKGDEGCQMLANVVQQRIQANTGTAFVNNIGPKSDGTFQTGVSSHFIESLDRLHSGSGLAEFIQTMPASHKMDGITTNPPLSSPLSIDLTQGAGSWRINNHLLIDNSANNFIALVNQSSAAGLCDPTLGNGADFTSVFRSWIPSEFDPSKVEIRLAVNVLENGRSLCGALPINDFDPMATMVEYRARVKIANAVSGDQQCEATGSVNFMKDTDPPLTTLRIVGAGSAGDTWCGRNPMTGVSKQAVPSACVTAGSPIPDVVLEVATVKDTTACRSCMAGLYDITDDGIFPITRAEARKGTCAAAKDGIRDCSTSCQPSDPGSVFFCRLGEKNWINGRTAGTPNGDWKPCHLAQVYDHNGSIISGASVSIEYGSNPSTFSSTGVYTGRDLSVSDTGTRARITVRNLLPNRSYQFDVRAVDSAGKFMGPSFCGVAGDACRPESGYGIAVAVINSLPVLGNTRSTSNVIALPKDHPTGQEDYDAILMNSFPEPVQCQAGAFDIATYVTNYAGGAISVPSGMGIENCSLNVSPAVSGMTCSCNNNGTCQANASTSAVTARFTANFTASNECSNLPSSPSLSYNWCQDLETTFDIKKVASRGFGDQMSPSLDLSSAVNFPASKSICGLSYAAPTADFKTKISHVYSGVFRRSPGSIPLSSSEYDPVVHSGCMSLEYDSNAMGPFTDHHGACVKAVDACGRYSTEEAGKLAYGVYLQQSTPLSMTTRIAQTGSIGYPPFKLGNRCAPGTYAGCNLLIGQRRCYGASTCDNYGASCHSGWDAATVSPSAAQACHDPKYDPSWSAMSTSARQAIAAARCGGASYQCVDALGRASSQMTCGGMGQNDYCTLNGTCNGAVIGTCTGGPDDGIPCTYNASCSSGTCSGAVAGTCAHDGSISCWDNFACNIAGVDVRCNVISMGTCQCPSGNACNPPETMVDTEVYYCPQARGACQVTPIPQAASFCSPDGLWVDWYCNYAALPPETAGGTITSTSTKCVHVVSGARCTPGSDTIREAPGAGP